MDPGNAFKIKKKGQMAKSKDMNDENSSIISFENKNVRHQNFSMMVKNKLIECDSNQDKNINAPLIEEPL